MKYSYDLEETTIIGYPPIPENEIIDSKHTQHNSHNVHLSLLVSPWTWEQCFTQFSISDSYRLPVNIIMYHIVQMYSGITRGRVLIGELCAKRLQKLTYLHLFRDCFMKISLESLEPSEEKSP